MEIQLHNSSFTHAWHWHTKIHWQQWQYFHHTGLYHLSNGLWLQAEVYNAKMHKFIIFNHKSYRGISVGYELTPMSWNSRINSLAVIYEFELTHLKECELWVWFNSKFMWVWVITTNFKINSLVVIWHIIVNTNWDSKTEQTVRH